MECGAFAIHNRSIIISRTRATLDLEICKVSEPRTITPFFNGKDQPVEKDFRPKRTLEVEPTVPKEETLATGESEQPAPASPLEEEVPRTPSPTPGLSTEAEAGRTEKSPAFPAPFAPSVKSLASPSVPSTVFGEDLTKSTGGKTDD